MVETLLGRPRRFPDLEALGHYNKRDLTRGEWMLVARAERQDTNSRIQGSAADVARISELDCSTPRAGDPDVASLAGIESLSGLTRLDLSHNALTDIAPLARLGKLDKVNLRGNRITDIRPISALPSRCEIDLLQNPIDDITPLLTRSPKPGR
jgi:Leucine-rich repeat (LRR) protein